MKMHYRGRVRPAKPIPAPRAKQERGNNSGYFTAFVLGLPGLKRGKALAVPGEHRGSYSGVISVVRLFSGRPYRLYKAVDGKRYVTVDD